MFDTAQQNGGAAQSRRGLHQQHQIRWRIDARGCDGMTRL
jgi:hypothetical protein